MRKKLAQLKTTVSACEVFPLALGIREPPQQLSGNTAQNYDLHPLCNSADGELHVHPAVAMETPQRGSGPEGVTCLIAKAAEGICSDGEEIQCAQGTSLLRV